jgi:hypothetical protein
MSIDVDDLYRRWSRHKEPTLTYPSLKGLAQWFLRECEKRKIDPYSIDFEAYVDPMLTYEENKIILMDFMTGAPTDDEIAEMYEQHKALLEQQVREKYPEIIEPLEERIIELEKTEKTSKRRYKKIRYLEQLLEETEKQLEEERAKPPTVKPIKVKVLKPFSHGIMDYTAGMIFETLDIDWAIELINKGYIRRVREEEAPMEPIKPSKVKWTRDLERRLRNLFESTMRAGLPAEKLPGLAPQRFIPDFREELETVKFLGSEGEMRDVIEKLAKSLIRRESRPKPPPSRVGAPPAGWIRTENGYLTPEGEFIPKEELPLNAEDMAVMRKLREELRKRLYPLKGKKAHQLSPRLWLESQGISWGDFMRMDPVEQKRLLDKYQKLSSEGE